MMDAHRPPTRRPVSLSLDAALVAEARALGIPLSAALESALCETVRAAREARWREENREAIAEYKTRVNAAGAFGEPFGNI